MSTERYKNGLIYKLVCNDTSITEKYIGSCCNFYRRKNNHKSDCNNINRQAHNHYKYKFIREHGGFENWSMIVIKEFPCNSKRELEAEERVQLELNGGELNSMKRPFISDEERNESNKEYKHNHKEYYKEYYKEYMKEYKQQHKEQRTQKYDCVCGGKYTGHNKIQHFKTKKHINYINDIND